MPGLFATKSETESVAISKLFPDLPPDRQRAVQDTLDGYCELLLRIFERLENEKLGNFDDLHGTS